MVQDDLRASVEQWIDQDLDPAAREELVSLLRRASAQGDAGAEADLGDRFAAPLAFGTAGLRGVLGAGPNRMNRAVVVRATGAVARELIDRVPGAAERGVVVGADGRRLGREFAEDVAAVLGASGLRVVLFLAPVPTPLVGFTVKHLRAAGGVVLTASHNPPQYSGYKLYWENAAQIVPPVDARIASRLEHAPPARHVPRAPLDELRARGRLSLAVPELERAYLTAIGRLAVRPGEGDRALRIVYTPLHGVGDALVRRALAQAGFSDVTSVPEQQEPDGAFPTVAFPNPEEAGSMDLALALARRTQADLVLANDPDADRLAVAEKDPTAPGGYWQLTGNELGALLGWYLLTEKPATRPRAVLASIVSSPLLGRIARASSVHYEETLTGFKWIANRAIELEREGYEFVFGFEEALGYSIGGVVFDKDGISAAVLAAEMAAVLRGRGSSLKGALDGITSRFGAFASLQRSVVREGAGGVAAMAAMMRRLRTSPPRAIAGDDVVRIADYESGVAIDVRSGARRPTALPVSRVLAFELASGARVVARPSGTEPKAKFYVDAREDVLRGEAPAQARARAASVAARLADAWVSFACGDSAPPP